MVKKVSAAHPLLHALLGNRQQGVQELFEALMTSALLEILGSAVDSSREYIELLTTLSGMAGVDANDIGVVEAQASHRKLVAVVGRIRQAEQERCHGQ